MNPHVVGGGEGSLRIRVQVEAGVIVAVALSSTRPVGMSAALVGREIGAAMRLLPRLFSLCGVAQAVAGLAAAETALGFVPPPPKPLPVAFWSLPKPSNKPRGDCCWIGRAASARIPPLMP